VRSPPFRGSASLDYAKGVAAGGRLKVVGTVEGALARENCRLACSPYPLAPPSVSGEAAGHPAQKKPLVGLRDSHFFGVA